MPGAAYGTGDEKIYRKPRLFPSTIIRGLIRGFRLKFPLKPIPKFPKVASRLRQVDEKTDE